MTAQHRLQGKLALVTGVTSGIGAATVRALLGEGMRVIGIGRDAERLAASARGFGAAFRPLLVDLAGPEARLCALNELQAFAEEPVSLLVNNAAECLYESPLEVAPERLSRLFEINVTAAIDLTQGVARRMQPGSHIINLSSVVARHLPAAKFAPYAATKAALDCLSEALRLELHPRGIQVSTVSPGLVDTPIYDKVQGFERARQKIREQVPTWLTAEDVASAIVWVATRPQHLVVSELSLLPSAQAR
ncbi:MAG TPA: SDR family NAD(P)-dependent oxidoreductase [Polyangiaceae bacterium]|nr:SDR family NAD(P)-dependent oxidoreductase [Polyangiaceae bacterium]